MQSPFSTTKESHHLEPPRSVERRRRGRGVDIMSANPTPERKRQVTHLPTPVTERHPRTKQDFDGKIDTSRPSIHLPTPQTLPRKRAAILSPDHSPKNDHLSPPPSPSGHTTFFLSAAASSTTDALPPRRRPGLMFAQQMGLATSGTSSSDLKFGGRLGLGVGMGGAMRGGAAHGPVDRLALDNPFLDTPSNDNTTRKAPQTAFLTQLRAQATPRSPGRDTSYVPQAMRRTADRSISPHPASELRRAKFAGARTPSPPAPLIGEGAAGPSTLTPRRQGRKQMMDEDNPFIAKPGEAVIPHATSEDHPLVTYVFRGSKKVFANPFVPPSTHYPPASLDASHPEFDTHPCPPPRLLWPTKQPAPETPRMLGTSMDLDADSSDGEEFVPESEEELPARRGLLFGNAPKRGSIGSSESAKKRVRL